MGGHYPSNRNFHGSFTRDPQTTFRVPSGIGVTPKKPPGFFPTNPLGGKPATFDPATWSGMPDDPWDVPHGKQPYQRRGRFPNPWRPRKVPFGRKPGVTVYPTFPGSPNLGKLFPWVGLAGGVAVYFWKYSLNYYSALQDAGFVKCCGGGGGNVYQGGCLNNGGCGSAPNLCGVGGQVPSGYMPPIISTCAPANLGYRLHIGQETSAAPWRFTVRETWMRPSRPGAEGPWPIPTFPQPAWVPWVDLPRPIDPNNELPMQPYMPPVNVPRPVWGNDPTRPPHTSYPPKTVGGNSVPGGTAITNPPPRPAPNPWIDIKTPGTPHSPVRPDPWTEKESKYTISKKGPFAALATGLLWASSKVYNGITETVDLVSAIYSALPDQVIAQHPNNLTDSQKLPFMLGAIWQARNQIDVAQALENIAYNAIEDAAWGRYFKTLNQVRRNSGTDVEGFDRQLGELNETFRDIYGWE